MKGERKVRVSYSRRRQLLLGVVVWLVVATGCAVADSVVVKPSTLGATGWVLATQEGSRMPKAEFCSGPAVPPAGTGSVLLSVHRGSSDPLPKVYLGTNKFNGVRLDRITQLKVWVCPASWKWPGGQPVTLELAVSKGNELRLCTFLPWGFEPTGLYGKMSWQEFDLLSGDGAWEVTNLSSQDRKGNWAWLVGRYPGASITTPPAKDWPFGTVSGTALNIKIGSGKAAGAFRKGTEWWKESEGCSAYVDKLTVGYRGDDGVELVTTYDFEVE